MIHIFISTRSVDLNFRFIVNKRRVFPNERGTKHNGVLSLQSLKGLARPWNVFTND